MQAKLLKQMDKGRNGWDDKNWTLADIKNQMIEHVKKGDMIDVANFAMFHWNQTAPVSPKLEELERDA